jgi:hypothetical protein
MLFISCCIDLYQYNAGNENKISWAAIILLTHTIENVCC